MRRSPRLLGRGLTEPKPDGLQPRYWSVEEHQRFLEAIQLFGYRNARAIAEYVGTRNATQVRTHTQKFRQRLEKQLEMPVFELDMVEPHPFEIQLDQLKHEL